MTNFNLNDASLPLRKIMRKYSATEWRLRGSGAEILIGAGKRRLGEAALSHSTRRQRALREEEARVGGGSGGKKGPCS